MNEQRTGAEWEAFLRKYKIKNITDIDEGHQVESTSGSTYTVRSIDKLDDMGSLYFTWTCDCPARKRCRHIDAVEQLLHAEAMADEDYDDVEMIERYA